MKSPVGMEEIDPGSWTALNYQKFGTKIWRQSNEGKTVSDTWNSQIHSQKA